MSARPLSLFDLPTVRNTDPEPSYAAAVLVRPGRAELREMIRSAVRLHGPQTAFEIAARILEREPDRWDEGTIRGEVSRVGFVQTPGGVSPRGHKCCKYGFEDGVVRVRNGVL